MDGFTNGEELGDPCCIWEPGKRAAWGWDITHPGGGKQTPLGYEGELMLNATSCKTVGDEYPLQPAAFKAWFYREHPEDTNYSLGHILFRAFVLLMNVGYVYFWLVGKQLYREFGRVAPRLPVLGTIAVVAFSYCYCDLASAFLHALLDNCANSHPILGGECKGFKHHHHHPRSLSVQPYLYWITHGMIATTAPHLMFLVLSALYCVPVVFDLLLFCTALFFPLGFCWHNFAHLPDDVRPTWFKVLQALGLALDSDTHIVHHREINHTWSVMAGIMDFVPNYFARWYYDRRDAAVTWWIVAAITIAPWHLAYVYYVVLKRGCREDLDRLRQRLVAPLGSPSLGKSCVSRGLPAIYV